MSDQTETETKTTTHINTHQGWEGSIIVNGFPSAENHGQWMRIGFSLGIGFTVSIGIILTVTKALFWAVNQF